MPTPKTCITPADQHTDQFQRRTKDGKQVYYCSQHDPGPPPPKQTKISIVVGKNPTCDIIFSELDGARVARSLRAGGVATLEDLFKIPLPAPSIHIGHHAHAALDQAAHALELHEEDPGRLAALKEARRGLREAHGFTGALSLDVDDLIAKAEAKAAEGTAP